MTPTRAAVAAIVHKDLTVELRTRESVPAMIVFALTTLVVFHFGLDRDALSGELAAGVLWVTVLFAAILGVNRLFVAEHEQHGFDGMLLAPLDRSAVLIAKAGVLALYLLALEVVAVPAFALFFLEDGLASALPKLAALVLLADVGIAAVGTLVATIGIRTRARDLLTALMLLPLLVPVVIAATGATGPLFEAGGSGPYAKWLAVLALYDLVFVLLAYAVYDFLLED